MPCGRIPVLVQKSGAIQNPADIDTVDESGVRLSNEVGKLLVGARLVNGVKVLFYLFLVALVGVLVFCVVG